jgi:O-antigen/teichoic acid export membrane protein
MSATAAPNPADLRGRVLRGLAWTGGSQVALQLVRMAVALLVARLLSPTQYGLAAAALVFTSLVLVFSDLAIGAALVQRKTLTDDDRDTAFWVTIASGVLFTAIGVALSGPVALLYHQPSMRPLLEVLSLSFIVTSLGATQQSLLVRDMQFRRSETVNVLGTFAGGLTAVTLALAGTGTWAIIGQQLAVAACTTAMLWRAAAWRPRMRFSRASLRYLTGFGAPLVGHRLLFYVHQNADNFLIGRFVGPAALGVYAIAYNVMLVPASRIGGPLQRVFAPAFARLQDQPERIAETWSRATRLLAVLTVPALGGVVVVAPDLIHVLLTDRYAAAAPLIQVLAWVGILQSLQSLNIDILMARNRTRTILRYSIGFTTAHVCSFVIGLHWGAIGVAAGYAISSTFVEPVLTVLTARALGVSPMVFVRSVAGVFQASALMCGLVLVTRLELLHAGVPALARLVLCVAIGAVSFVPLCAWRVPQLRDDLRAIRGRAAAAPTPALATVPAT